jgi:nucleotide-binding universal stress UspA family protein
MINRVLVGVDFSVGSKAALEQAARWAARFDVPLVALHVLQAPTPILVDSYPVTMDIAGTQAIKAHAMEHLAEWIRDLPGAMPEVIWGSPAEILVREADPDSLLVVGQTGHSRLQQFLFGSTASKVVRHAPCDVLVVRSEQWTAA